MCVLHGRAKAPVAEQILNGPDVRALGKKMCGEGMPECVATGTLGDSGQLDGPFHGSLDHGLVQVVTLAVPRVWICVYPSSGKGPLPLPFASGSRALSFQGSGKSDPAVACGEIFIPLQSSPLKAILKLAACNPWQHGDAIPKSFGVADDDFSVSEVEILDSQS